MINLDQSKKTFYYFTKKLLIHMVIYSIIFPKWISLAPWNMVMFDKIQQQKKLQVIDKVHETE